jgi:hypothetical protein
MAQMVFQSSLQKFKPWSRDSNMGIAATARARATIQTGGRRMAETCILNALMPELKGYYRAPVNARHPGELAAGTARRHAPRITRTGRTGLLVQTRMDG